MGVEIESQKKLEAWLTSCTRSGRISRNTIAVGIVALHHLQQQSPVSRHDVLSQGGELKSARSGLANILEAHGVDPVYLKEVTTRQAGPDAQRLFESLNWGRIFQELSDSKREVIIERLIGRLVDKANKWLRSQNLKLRINRRQAPATWLDLIISNAKSRSGGVVEQHLVGAKLERRFDDVEVENHPAHAADLQTERAGDFAIERLVYHVTAVPSRGVIKKCRENLSAGLQPILLTPKSSVNRAVVFAEEEGIEDNLNIFSIEDFVALNIIELATEEEKDYFVILQEIVEIYNRRLEEVETDLSLLIEVR